MKTFMIENDGYVPYGRYFSFVVVAEDKDKALELCAKEDDAFTKEDTTITEITPAHKAGIVLGSFNEG